MQFRCGDKSKTKSILKAVPTFDVARIMHSKEDGNRYGIRYPSSFQYSYSTKNLISRWWIFAIIENVQLEPVILQIYIIPPEFQKNRSKIDADKGSSIKLIEKYKLWWNISKQLGIIKLNAKINIPILFLPFPSSPIVNSNKSLYIQDINSQLIAAHLFNEQQNNIIQIPSLSSHQQYPLQTRNNSCAQARDPLKRSDFRHAST